MPEIVVFGAGNIGRSFIGQIFSRAGFEVVLVDVDAELIAELNRHRSYTVVHRHPDGREEQLEIAPVRAVDGRDGQAVAAALASVQYVATSVGAAALPHVLPALAEEMERRTAAESSSAAGRPPLDIILAENIHGAGELVRRAVPGAGVIECSVGKMVPIVPPELRAQNIRTVYAEAFNTLIVDREGWKNSIPPVPELYPVSPIAAWIDRKLYIHNLGHAACAYLAFEKDESIQYIWQAVADRDILDRTRHVMESCAEGLLREYPGVFTMESLEEHIQDLLYRFSSRSLGDTVYRVGRDLKRKLGPSDRIAGSLRLLQRQGCDTAPLEEVYRAALNFRARDDSGEAFPPDSEFLDHFARVRARPEEARRLLAEVSGFDRENESDRAILARLVPDSDSGL